MITRRHLLQGGLLASGGLMAGCATATSGGAQEPWRTGALLHADDFRNLDQWVIESERSAVVKAEGGALDIDTPDGLSAWFRPALEGPVIIRYDAVAVSKGGANDQVSDLNAFWMATDTRSPGDLFARPRSGVFADYDALQTYYVGQGGNRNTTTRFRRYIGKPGDRPILPQHDLGGRDNLLVPNQRQTIRLVAFGGLIQYWRDGRKVFEMNDPEPYTRGWFAIRTTRSHLRISRLRIYRLEPR